MEYDELLQKVLKERKQQSGERFVPPPVEVQQLGQRTAVSVDKFADYVKRPIKHVAQYLMHELNAPGQIDNGKVILGGRFSRNVVQEKINSYVKEYVICKQCASPDTQMSKVDNNYTIKCLGCGAEYPVGRIKK